VGKKRYLGTFDTIEEAVYMEESLQRQLRGDKKTKSSKNRSVVPENPETLFAEALQSATDDYIAQLK
jgi:hypothetical protein